jgi:hypothetical protein
MITFNGTKLLGKYLVGQIPTFASHMAIGCGPNVIPSATSLGDYSSKTALDFEMLRVPIVSRTTNRITVGETDMQQVIFTAEIPSSDRYGITEIGVYPSQENNVFGSVASKTLFSFNDAEDWQAHDVSASTLTDIDIYTAIVNVDQDVDSGSGGTMENVKTFRLASDNAMFRNETRLSRQEQPRFLNRSLVLRGDYSLLSGAVLDYADADHVMLSQSNLAELDTAHKALDQIKLAFSVIPKSLATPVLPTEMLISIDFALDDGSVEYARFEYIMSEETNPEHILSDENDRYMIVTKTFNELEYSANFNWADVKFIKVYVNIDDADDNYVALDGIRFENKSSLDDQYALAGYTVLKTSDTDSHPAPIEKTEGSVTYVEFIFALGVN